MLLMTGATGFLGRHIYRALCRDETSMRLVLRQSAVLAVRDEDEIVRTTDLFAEGRDWWREQLAGIDRVLHVAWMTEPGAGLSSPLHLACLNGTLKMGLACAEQGVDRFVGIGTCFEYDEDAGMVPVDTPLRPRSLYGAAKASAFHTLSALFAERDVSFAWCRPFYLYGDGEDPRRFFPYLHARMKAGEVAELTRGAQVRDYLDAADAGSMIAVVLRGSQTGPINICSGKPLTIRAFAESIADEYGRRDLLDFGARPENPVDPLVVVGVPNLDATPEDG